MLSRHSKRWVIVTLGLSILVATYSRASDHTVTDYTAVENYAWTKGCAPTAAATVFSYYDSYNSEYIGYGALIQWYHVEYDTITRKNNNVPQVLDWLALAMGTSGGATSLASVGSGIITVANTDCGYSFNSHQTTSGPLNDWCWGTITSEIDAGRPFVWSMSITGNGHSMAAIGYTDSKDVMVYDANTVGSGVQYYYYNQWPYSSVGANQTYVDTVEPGGKFTSDLSLLSLRSGGTVYAGQSASIQWEQWGDSSIKTVDILYSTDSGNSWNYITQSLTTSVGSDSYSWTVPSTPGSNYRVRIIGRSSAGSVISEDASSNDFVVVSSDTTPPTVSISSPTSGQTFTASPVAVSGTANDPGSPSTGVSLVQVQVNGTAGTWAAATGTTSWSASVALTSGANTIYLRSQDGAGNYSTVASVNVTYNPPDTTPPTVSISSPTSGQTFTASPVAVSGTANDPGSPSTGVSLVQVQVNGTAGTWAAATGTTSWSASVALTSGPNTIYVRIQDGAGNYSTIALVNVNLTLPTAPQLTGMNVSNGVFRFTLNGPLGSNYVIYVSSDLAHWLPFSTNTVPSCGSFSCSDPAVATCPQQFYKAVLTNVCLPPGPSLIASNLNGPQALVLDGNYVYCIDNSSTDGIIKSVPNNGGTVATLLTGLHTYEGGVGSFVVSGGTIYGGYGGYNGENMFSAPTNGGTAAAIISATDGRFIGVANSLLYYGSGFNYINSVTTSGANSTQLASGIWVRGCAVDGSAIYFSDYWSKDVRKYSFTSGSITPLITGNSSSDGGLFIDANNVYFNNAGNVLEVSKGGGAVTTLVSSGAAGGYVSDGSSVFYVETNAIKSVPVIGGDPSTVVNLGTGGLSSMAVDGSYLYWSDTSGGAGAGKIWRMAKP
jgi:hypothetical protein